MRVDSGTARYLAIVFGILFILSSMTIGTLEFVGVATDSITLPQQMAKEQNTPGKALVLPGDLKYWAAYKLPHIADNKPEIILVGSSRGGQIRSEMFKPYKFYNASFTSWNLRQLTDMVDRITRVSKPRIILVSLDYFMFAADYEKSVRDGRTMYFNNDFRFRYDSFFNFIKVLTDHPSLFSEYILPRLLGRDTPGLAGLKLVGIDAMQNKAGFRFDGSLLYPAGLLASAAQNTQTNKGLIDMAPGAPHIDQQQIIELERLAALAHDRDVQLIGIQLPILKASLDVLNNDQSYHYYSGVWREFESANMHKKLSELGIPFFDLCCGSISADSRMFIDAAHLGERGMLSMMINLLNDSKFRSFFPAVSIEALKEALSDAQKRGEFFHVFRNQ